MLLLISIENKISGHLRSCFLFLILFFFLFGCGSVYAAVPSPVTLPASSVQSRSAFLRGSVSVDSSQLSSVKYFFEWGNQSDFLDRLGCLYFSVPSGGALDCQINNLTPGTSYFYRVVIQDNSISDNPVQLRGSILEFRTMVEDSAGASSGSSAGSGSGSSGGSSAGSGSGSSGGSSAGSGSGSSGGSSAGSGSTAGSGAGSISGGSSGGNDSPSPSSSFGVGLVPCGTTENPNLCTFTDIVELLKRVMNFLLVVVLIPLATLAIAFVGFQYLTAAGNPGKLAKAHEVLWDVLYGIIIAVAAWAIVNTIFAILTNWGGLPSITGN